MAENNPLLYLSRSCASIIERTLDDLVPTLDFSPYQVLETKRAIKRCLKKTIEDYDLFSNISEHHQTLKAGELSARFFEASQICDCDYIKENLRSLAQSFGVLTGQKEENNFYPFALRDI